MQDAADSPRSDDDDNSSPLQAAVEKKSNNPSSSTDGDNESIHQIKQFLQQYNKGRAIMEILTAVGALDSDLLGTLRRMGAEQAQAWFKDAVLSFVEFGGKSEFISGDLRMQHGTLFTWWVARQPDLFPSISMAIDHRTLQPILSTLSIGDDQQVAADSPKSNAKSSGRAARWNGKTNRAWAAENKSDVRNLQACLRLTTSDTVNFGQLAASHENRPDAREVIVEKLVAAHSSATGEPVSEAKVKKFRVRAAAKMRNAYTTMRNSRQKHHKFCGAGAETVPTLTTDNGVVLAAGQQYGVWLNGRKTEGDPLQMVVRVIGLRESYKSVYCYIVSKGFHYPADGFYDPEVTLLNVLISNVRAEESYGKKCSKPNVPSHFLFEATQADIEFAENAQKMGLTEHVSRDPLPEEFAIRSEQTMKIRSPSGEVKELSLCKIKATRTKRSRSTGVRQAVSADARDTDDAIGSDHDSFTIVDRCPELSSPTHNQDAQPAADIPVQATPTALQPKRRRPTTTRVKLPRKKTVKSKLFASSDADALEAAEAAERNTVTANAVDEASLDELNRFYADPRIQSMKRFMDDRIPRAVQAGIAKKLADTRQQDLRAERREKRDSKKLMMAAEGSAVAEGSASSGRIRRRRHPDRLSNASPLTVEEPLIEDDAVSKLSERDPQQNSCSGLSEGAAAATTDTANKDAADEVEEDCTENSLTTTELTVHKQCQQLEAASTQSTQQPQQQAIAVLLNNQVWRPIGQELFAHAELDQLHASYGVVPGLLKKGDKHADVQIVQLADDVRRFFIQFENNQVAVVRIAHPPVRTDERQGSLGNDGMWLLTEAQLVDRSKLLFFMLHHCRLGHVHVLEEETDDQPALVEIDVPLNRRLTQQTNRLSELFYVLCSRFTGQLKFGLLPFHGMLSTFFESRIRREKQLYSVANAMRCGKLIGDVSIDSGIVSGCPRSIPYNIISENLDHMPEIYCCALCVYGFIRVEGHGMWDQRHTMSGVLLTEENAQY